MGFSLGELVFKMSADTASLRADMSDAKKSVGEATESIAKGAEFARNALELMGVALGAREAVEFVKSAIEIADVANKAAQKIGLTTEALTSLQYAAKLADVDSESLQISLTKLAKNVAAAATGVGAQAEAFDRLGISTKENNGSLRDIDSVLLDVSDKFARMPDGIEKAALAQELFGKSGANMIPLLNAGSEKIREMREEAEKLGVVISSETAKSAEEFNDNMTRLKAASDGAKNSLMVELLPALTRISNVMVDAAKDGGVLYSLFVGLGGAAKEAFSRDNYTPIESAKAAVRDLNTELERSQYTLNAMKASGQANGAQFDEMSRKVEDLTRQLNAAVEKRNELLAPKKEAVASPAGLAALEIPDDVLKPSSSDLGVSGAALTARMDAILDGQKKLDELNKHLSRMMMEAGGQADAIINRLTEKNSGDFFKSDSFKSDTKDSLDSLGDNPEQKAKETADMHARIEAEELRHQAALGNIEAQWTLKRRAFVEMNAKMQAKTVLSELTMLTAGVAQHNRAAFEVNKAASTATAIISTYEMAVSAYKALAGIYIVGPVLGAAAAAAAISFGMAQVSAIQSTSFEGGGGGTTPSAAGGSSVVNGSPVSSSGAQAAPQVTAPAQTIIFSGDIHSNDAERLMRDLSKLINDGDWTIIDSNSRQALQIRQGA